MGTYTKSTSHFSISKCDMFIFDSTYKNIGYIQNLVATVKETFLQIEEMGDSGQLEHVYEKCIKTWMEISFEIASWNIDILSLALQRAAVARTDADKIAASTQAGFQIPIGGRAAERTRNRFLFQEFNEAGKAISLEIFRGYLDGDISIPFKNTQGAAEKQVIPIKMMAEHWADASGLSGISATGNVGEVTIVT